MPDAHRRARSAPARERQAAAQRQGRDRRRRRDRLAELRGVSRARSARKLACDVVVVSDTAVFAEDVPSLTTSLRGLVHWEITVHGPAGDLHSGYFGGVVKNPLEALAQILAALKDGHGRVAVPGFYDDVRELSPQERAGIAALPFDPAKTAHELGVTELGGEASRRRSNGCGSARRSRSTACTAATRAPARRPSSRRSRRQSSRRGSFRIKTPPT